MKKEQSTIRHISNDEQRDTALTALPTGHHHHLPTPGMVEGSLVEIDDRPIQGTRVGRSPKARPVFPVRFLLLLAPVLALALLICAYLLYWSNVTVVIHLRVRERTALLSLDADSAPQGQGQVLLRIAEETAVSPPIHIHPTGTKLLPATRAAGLLTWYNQQPTTQVIPAETVLSVSSSGVQVVTDEAVSVPPASIPPSGPPVPSESAGWAHAALPGVGGNLGAGAVYLLCPCGTGLVVKNAQPFTGGRDALTVSVVLQSDIDGATGVWRAQLERQAGQALVLVRHGWTDVAPARCVPRLRIDHPAGDELPVGTLVSASLSVTCTTSLYDQREAAQQAQTSFLVQSRTYLSPGLVLRNVSATLVLIAPLSEQHALLTYRVSAWWEYPFGERAQRALRGRLAGISSVDAARALSSWPGISQYSIEGPFPWLPLPTDPQRIHLALKHSAP